MFIDIQASTRMKPTLFNKDVPNENNRMDDLRYIMFKLKEANFQNFDLKTINQKPRLIYE